MRQAVLWSGLLNFWRNKGSVLCGIEYKDIYNWLVYLFGGGDSRAEYMKKKIILKPLVNMFIYNRGILVQNLI